MVDRGILCRNVNLDSIVGGRWVPYYRQPILKQCGTNTKHVWPVNLVITANAMKILGYKKTQSVRKVNSITEESELVDTKNSVEMSLE